MRSIVSVGVVLSLALVVRGDLPSGPGDWPGWRGPARDNISKERGLLKAWPKDGPELVWKVTGLGIGYSTPAVARDVIYVLGNEGEGTESLFALSAANGEKLWSTPFGKNAGGYSGARSTPTVDGDMIYALGSNGALLAAKAKTGEPVWKKDLKRDFNGRFGSWAYAESPLIDGDLLVCTPGGSTSPIVALEKRTGEVVWKASLTSAKETGTKDRLNTTAGYSSVVSAEIHGVKQYIQFLAGGVVGVEARTGRLLWHYGRPANGTANISTPVPVGEDGIFAASGYGTGGGLATIVKKDGEFEAEEKFFVREMQNHHGGMVAVNGFLYGTNSSAILCLDLATGKIAWTNKSVGKGSISYADGCLYVRSERGPVALVEANPKEYVELGRFEQPDRSSQRAWPHPVVAGGKLYLRDQDILLCYDVKQK